MSSQIEFQEKLNNLVTDDKSGGREDAKFRKQNRDWLLKSAEIALKIIDILKENKMTQAELAAKLETSPQNISKILKGQENLTLETIVKLEKSLGIELIAVPKYLKQIEIELPKMNFSSIVNPRASSFIFIEKFQLEVIGYTQYKDQPAVPQHYKLIA